eukprot:363076-Chlamydomonas_euryale.AAC.11
MARAFGGRENDASMWRGDGSHTGEELVAVKTVVFYRWHQVGHASKFCACIVYAYITHVPMMYGVVPSDKGCMHPCLPACPPFFLPACLPACLSPCLPVFLSSFTPLLPSLLPAYPPDCLPARMPTCPHACMHVCLLTLTHAPREMRPSSLLRKRAFDDSTAETLRWQQRAQRGLDKLGGHCRGRGACSEAWGWAVYGWAWVPPEGVCMGGLACRLTGCAWVGLRTA